MDDSGGKANISLSRQFAKLVRLKPGAGATPAPSALVLRPAIFEDVDNGLMEVLNEFYKKDIGIYYVNKWLDNTVVVEYNNKIVGSAHIVIFPKEQIRSDKYTLFASKKNIRVEVWVKP